MQPLRHSPSFIISALASLILCHPPGRSVVVGGEAGNGPTNQLPSAVAEELQKLREEVEEQSQRLDRLYRALEPHLKQIEAQAALKKKEAEEDRRLALERIAEVSVSSKGGKGCLNPTADEFAVITRGGGIEFYDAQGQRTRALRQPGQIVTAIAFSPDGKELLAGTDSGALLVWKNQSEACSMLKTNGGIAIGRVAWLGTERVAWGSYVDLWEGGKSGFPDRRSGAVLSRADGKKLWDFRSLIRDDFFTLAGAANGRYLLVMDVPGLPRGAFLLDGEKGEIIKQCPDQERGGTPLSVAFSPDGKTMAAGYAPYGVALWNVQTGELIKYLDGHGNWVVSLCFSSDGRRLLSGAGDSTARLWDVGSGKEIGRLRFEGPSTYLNSVGLSSNGLVFVLAQSGLMVIAKPAAADK